MGLNSPRTSAGASGFGSNVSCCGGPPCSQRKSTFFARPNGASTFTAGVVSALAFSSAGSDSPSALNPPTRNHSPPLTPSQRRAGRPGGGSPTGPQKDQPASAG